MTTVNDILNNLRVLAPEELKMDFDNVGLLVGDRTHEVNKCMLALDITQAVIDEAIEFAADLIVSHHPVVFTAQKTLLEDNLVGSKLIKLVKNDVSAICMHTNLDVAQFGVNDALAAELDLVPKRAISADGCGRIGEYESAIDFDCFLRICKSVLNTNGIRYVSSGKPVKKLAVMGGSGGDYLYLVKELGCDTYVTADVKYNQFLDAKEFGINLIDADHFCTENVIISVLLGRLSGAFPEVNFKISEAHGQTVCFY